MVDKAPARNKPAFICPHCGAFAQQHWVTVIVERTSLVGHVSHGKHDKLGESICQVCRRSSIWLEVEMVSPAPRSAARPHPDMPPYLAEDFEEAAAIAQRSPRGAAALLRLVVQKLCRHLGQSGKDINGDIKALVAAGLAPEIQQALDTVRVIGNEAVHPGELNLNDTPELAHGLFEVVNHIIEDRIARPRKMKELYEKLPGGKLKAIAQRDDKGDA